MAGFSKPIPGEGGPGERAVKQLGAVEMLWRSGSRPGCTSNCDLGQVTSVSLSLSFTVRWRGDRWFLRPLWQSWIPWRFRPVHCYLLVWAALLSRNLFGLVCYSGRSGMMRQDGPMILKFTLQALPRKALCLYCIPSDILLIFLP